MQIKWLPFLGLLALCCLWPYNTQAFQQFTKDSSQYCLPKMSLEKQNQFSRRIMNIGASYGHGCPTCDSHFFFTGALKETNDKGWFRRNYLLHFTQQTPWKNNNLFKGEFISLVENDGYANLTRLFSHEQLQESPYRSRWVYRLDDHAFGVMDADTEHLVTNSDDGFEDQAFIVEGAKVFNKHRENGEPNLGHVIQFYPGIYRGEGPHGGTLIDFATDDSRSYHLMRHLGDQDLYYKLKKGGWLDHHQREELIQKTVKRIQKAEPSYIIIPDGFFWDSVPWLVQFLRESHPNSFVTKLLTSKILTQTVHRLALIDSEVESRMHDDYFEVLARVSRGQGSPTGEPVPIFLSRLIDKPAQSVLERGLEEEFSVLIGTFIKSLIAVDVTDELRYQFARAAEEYGNDSNYVESKEATPEEENLIIKALANSTLKPIISRILQDLPLILKAADRSFTAINDRLEEFTNRTDNNVHLVNADEFYHNFHRLVNPRTMHPSVEGSKFIADIVNRAICKKEKVISPSDPKPGPYQRYQGHSVLFWDGVNVMREGPSRNRLKLRGHHWNLSQAHIVPTAETTIISGNLTRNIKLRRDTKLEYTLAFDRKGNLLAKTITPHKNTAWYQTATDLIEDLGREIALTYPRNP